MAELTARGIDWGNLPVVIAAPYHRRDGYDLVRLFALLWVSAVANDRLLLLSRWGLLQNDLQGRAAWMGTEDFRSGVGHPGRKEPP